MSRPTARERLRTLTGQPAGPSAREPSRVHLALARPVPGVVVRLVPAALVLVCAAVVDEGAGGLLIALVAAGLVTWRPSLPVPAAVVVVAGLWVFAQDDLLAPRTARALERSTDGLGDDDRGLLTMVVLVLCLHLLVRASALAARVAWRGAVEAAVLTRVGRAVLGSQLVAQALLLTVVWLRSGVGAGVAGHGWLRAVAVVAVVVVALLVVPRDWLVRRGGS